MANRDNHYEAAFEAYLRSRLLPYVAVDEARRARWAGGSLKSLDFIVSPDGAASWLVDVKGRRFPSGRQPQYWKNWSTRDDLVSLSRWERLFGENFSGLFVFAYNVIGERSPLPAEKLFTHRGAVYGFIGIPVTRYASHARCISPAWDTVAMPAARFRQFAMPVETFFEGQGSTDPSGAR